jgi:hypothetical protein
MQWAGFWRRNATTRSSVVDAHSSRLSIADVAAVGSLSIVFLTAWTYVSGWFYVYRYYHDFRIPLWMLDFPFQYYMIYGGLVLRRNIWLLLLVFVAMLATFRWSGRLGHFGVITVVMFAALIAFVCAQVGGIVTAREEFRAQRVDGYSAFPRVHLVVKKGNDAVEAALGDIVTHDCGRLVTATKDYLFLIRPISSTPAAELHTFVVASNETPVFRIRADSGSCP